MEHEDSANGPSVMVFALSPILTITIDESVAGAPETHLQAGGQRFWIARMVARPGLPVTLCGPHSAKTTSECCKL
jgi:hypothetical protein